MEYLSLTSASFVYIEYVVNNYYNYKNYSETIYIDNNYFLKWWTVGKYRTLLQVQVLVISSNNR